MKKTRDGVVLSCLRDGAPAAVQRTGYGGFFALHDLMHYAAETTLGWNEAFFGLMAAGWDFAAFSDKNDSRYRSLPAQAGWAEHLVAIMTRHYQTAGSLDEDLLPLWTDEVNAELAAVRVPVRLDTAQVLAICRRFGDLAERWVAVPAGEHLELEFPTANRGARR